MTFEEAAQDPRRPLSLTPREWMYSVEASLAEEEELVEKGAKRIASEQNTSLPSRSGTGIEKIDLGIDQMVQAVQVIQSGLMESRMADLLPAERRAIETIRDIIETAIEPYLLDIIRASDSIEGE